MTFGTTAMWLGSTTMTTKVARNQTRAMFGGPTVSFGGGILPTTGGGAHGVVGDDDLLVTATGGLNFSVATGNAVMLGTSSLAQGAYAGIYNDAALAGAVGTYHATLPRKDIIAVRIRDTDEDASGSEDCGLVVIAGTANASPTDPTIPANHLVLARANVPATSGTITIDDLRTYASALGAQHRCRSTTRPTAAALKTVRNIRETDTQRIMYYTDAAAWEIVSEPPQTWNVTSIQQGAGVACTTNFGQYQRSRGQFWATIDLTINAGGTGGAVLQLALPVTLSNALAVGGSFRYLDAGTAIYGGVIVASTTTVIQFLATDVTRANQFGADPNLAIASTDQLSIDLHGYYV